MLDLNKLIFDGSLLTAAFLALIGVAAYSGWIF